ncbi:hypothetical protein [Methanobacterium alcaliphilum]|uniref:hypothetical protein n=1 Tax=Methanobacterium alcaliphilum TaxID=392018 RepID=UPI00200A440B|nr:hypothetical protein [Methanobacterium alcaliphilum]MCK9150499.1 hypothetical protein [Methanobacterium alcaliphilum]
MKLCYSQVAEYTLKSKVKVKNGYQKSEITKNMVPLDWSHPFAKEEKVAVIGRDELELLRTSLKQLKEDKESLRKQLGIVSDQLHIIKKENKSFWK